MKLPAPILVTDLFPRVNRELVVLLRDLSPDDWKGPTACARWNVRDVASHLLDTNLRRLALHRDGYASPDTPDLRTDRDLVEFINQMNDLGVKAARRLSPRLLIELLETSGQQLFEFFRALDPFAPAMFPVSWAGESESANWFDIAREYTEKWHHQEQIREATGRPGLTSREYLFPVLDTFLRALPHIYRHTQATDGTLIRIEVTGPAGGDWFLLREQGQWRLLLEVAEKPAAEVEMSQDVAWKLCTKGLGQAAAEQTMRFSGSRDLGRPVLNLTCIVG
jgi:uncharacterized protein (TIGR03083 family)